MALRRALAALVVLCSACSPAIGQSSGINERNAVLMVNMRFLGQNVLPFTLQKQNAVIAGISNVLQDGVTASDIALNVLQTYDSITATGNRRLLSMGDSWEEHQSRQLLQSTFPAVDTQLNITTSASKVQNESNTLVRASNVTYDLASSIGSQGLQTQQIVVQSISVQNGSAPSPVAVAPVPSQSSPPPPAPAPIQDTSSPAESMASPSPEPAALESNTPVASSSPPAAAPALANASGVGSSASGSASSSSSGISTGAIVGIAVGAAVLVILIICLIVFLAKRRRKIDQQNQVISYLDNPGKSTSGVLPVMASAGITDDKVVASPVDEKVETFDDKVEVPRETEIQPRPQNERRFTRHGQRIAKALNMV